MITSRLEGHFELYSAVLTLLMQVVEATNYLLNTVIPSYCNEVRMNTTLRYHLIINFFLVEDEIYKGQRFD